MAKKDTTEETPEAGQEVTLAQVLDRLAAIQEAGVGVQAAQLKQTAPKSNASPPKISVYNPRGEKDFPMPRLKCAITFGFTLRPEQHSLDREEVELFNLLEPSDDYTVEMLDGTQQRICVIGRRSQAGALESLVFKGPKDEDGAYSGLVSNDNRGNFPSLKAIMRQMIGDATEDVQTMRQEVAAIKRGELKTTEDGRSLLVSVGA